MNIIYLDDYHFFNESIIPDSKEPSLVKVGIVGIEDLKKFKSIYPKSKVMAYEADYDNFKTGMTSPMYIDKFYHKAVSDDGHIDLYRFTNVVSNSEFPRHTYDRNCVLKERIAVESVSLSTVLSENCLSYIDILILNCEGGELKIMRQLENAELRNRIGQICVSFHDPRIYPTEKKRKIMDLVGSYYHIIRGVNTIGGIPDYLMIRKV